MNRVKRISAKDYYGDVEVTVRVRNTVGMGKHEVDTVVTEMADGAMRLINEARYFKVPLSKIWVG